MLGWHNSKEEVPKEKTRVLAWHKITGFAVAERNKRYRNKYEWELANYEGTFCFMDKEGIIWREMPELPKECEIK